jgi:hypothetical protein
MRVLLAIGAVVLMAGAGACSASSSDAGSSDDGGNDSDASTSDGAPTVADSGDASATPDSGAANDSGSILADGGFGPGPDAGCAFESIGAGVSAGDCSKYQLVACGASSYNLSCDCGTSTCACDQDGTVYASFAPPSDICADANLDGGCAITSALRALAQTSCGVYY